MGNGDKKTGGSGAKRRRSPGALSGLGALLEPADLDFTLGDDQADTAGVLRFHGGQLVAENHVRRPAGGEGGVGLVGPQDFAAVYGNQPESFLHRHALLDKVAHRGAADGEKFLGSGQKALGQGNPSGFGMGGDIRVAGQGQKNAFFIIGLCFLGTGGALTGAGKGRDYQAGTLRGHDIRCLRRKVVPVVDNVASAFDE